MTFSRADRCGSRWNDWNTNPMRSARTAERAVSDSRETSTPSSQ